MAALDFVSLSVLTLLSLSLMALALPFAMGRRLLSPAAQRVQRYFLLHPCAWALILLASHWSGTVWEAILAILSTCAVALGQWNLAHALRHWLGERPYLFTLRCLCWAGPIGFTLLWSDSSWRFAWFSAVQGMGLLLLARMCLWPAYRAARGWRLVMLSCGAAMGCTLLLRAVLALWMPDTLPRFTAPSGINHAFVILAHIATTLTLMAVMVAWREESHRRIEELALTDTLTGLSNRRAFEELGQLLIHRARREHRPVALLLVDVDHFKRINDTHGHHTGDQALVLFAQVLQRQVRLNDMVARWGGEEFCVLVHALPGAIPALYQRIREELHRRSLQELGWAMDFSAGCARPSGDDSSLQHLMERADTALYQAKAAGRAQLVFAEEPDTAPAPSTAPASGAPTAPAMLAAAAGHATPATATAAASAQAHATPHTPVS